MNRKKIITVVSMVCALVMTGCGKKESSVEEGTTIGTKLASRFHSEAKESDDPKSIAESLAKSDVFGEIKMDTVSVEEGYLAGFDGDITGFSEGVKFAPMINTIPFVGYVFVSQDPDALTQELKEKAVLNWNICTQADEMIAEEDGNLVFFCMAPEAFE